MSSTQEVGDIFGAGKGHAQDMLRSPTVLIVAVGLWGMNLFFFRLFGIDYRTVLNYDLIEMDGGDPYASNNDNQHTTGGGAGDITAANSASNGTTNLIGNDSEMGQSPQQHLGMRTNNNGILPPQPLKAKGSNDEQHPHHRNTHHHRDGSDMTPTALTNSNNITPAINTSTSKGSESAATINSDVDGGGIFDGNSGVGVGVGGGIDSYYGSAITWFKLVVFSFVLLCLLHFTTHFWMDHLGRGSVGAVFSFYGAVLVYIFLPLQSNRWLRRAFVIVLQRSFELVNPRCSCIFLPTGMIPRKIPFVDVFYADAMCSLSKVFFDWGMLLHQASHYPDPVPNDVHNIVLPSALAAVPYIIRARQCLIMYTVGRLQSDPKRYQHIANAIKYSTSLWPLVLSAYQKTLSKESAANLNGLLFLLLTINATYSLYWDIVMDWGMMQDPSAVVQTATASLACYPKGGVIDSKGHHVVASKQRDGPVCHHVCLRPRLRFGLTLSTLILVADAFLRFSWTLKLIGGGKLFPSNDAFVLCTQFLEVFRRAIWNLLRVEWENIKQKKWQSAKTKRDKAHDSLSDHEDDYYDDHLHDTDEEGEYHHGGSGDGLVSPKDDPNGGVLEMKSLLGKTSPSKITRV